jgi:hypothetical protein
MTFGSDEPEHANCFGLVERKRHAMAVGRGDEEEERRKRRKKDSAALPVSVNRLMPADALKIRGQHNAINALAALALCRAIGLPLHDCCTACANIRASRIASNWSRRLKGVEYYDDSKGTNVGATVAALSGLGKAAAGTHGHLILIAGGDGKGQDFSPADGTGHQVCPRGAADRPGRAGNTGRAGNVGRRADRLRHLGRSGATRRRTGGKEMLCCCRRHAPASTCSRIMHTARRYSSMRCESWRSHRERWSHEVRPAHFLFPRRKPKPVRT